MSDTIISWNHWGKLIAFATVVLLATGTLIENVAFSDMGMTAFSPPHARSIFVGLSFFIYILLPVVPSAIVYKYAIGTWGKSISSTWSRSLLYIAAWLGTWFVCSTATQYFISIHHFKSSAYMPMIRLGDLYASGVFFWYHLSLFWGPAWLLTLTWVHRPDLIMRLRNSKHKSGILFILGVGLLTFPKPYCVEVYPNIDKSVGGGQPTVLFLKTTEDIRPLLDELVRLNTPVLMRRIFESLQLPGDYLADHEMTTLDGKVSFAGPLLLVHEDSNYLYISSIPDYGLHNLTAIPRDKIDWYRTMYSRVVFRNHRVSVIADAWETASSPSYESKRTLQHDMVNKLADKANELSTDSIENSNDESTSDTILDD